VLDAWLIATAGLGVGLAMVSRWLVRHPLSEPLLALVLGVLVGPSVLGLVAVPDQLRLSVLEVVARLTLAVAMMAVALRYPLPDVLARRRPVAWLLLVVLPLMAVTGATLATTVLGAGVGIALVLGAALAPTDPILASAVVTDEPAERIVPPSLRETLSIESGANDGLALALVLLAAAVTTGQALTATALEALWAVVGAVAIGTAVGWATGRVLLVAERHGDVDPPRELTFSLVLGLATVGLAGLARTADLLAVFVCGLAYNAVMAGSEREREEQIDESVNRFLVLPLFVLLGVTLPWSGWLELGWRGLGFAVAVLLLRRLPWVLASRSLAGAPRLADAVWLGWFGPIGGAAVYYLAHLDALGVDDPVVWQAGSLVVALSTVLHGTSAAPGREWYRRRTAP
jgi:sodium/hydrogen antiporter